MKTYLDAAEYLPKLVEANEIARAYQARCERLEAEVQWLARAYTEARRELDRYELVS